MPARHTGATEKIYRISSSKCHIQKFCFRIIAEGYIRGNTLRANLLHPMADGWGLNKRIQTAQSEVISRSMVDHGRVAAFKKLHVFLQ